MPLSGKQKRYLRGLGHALTSVVTIGKEGITEALTDAVLVALRDHELVKIRVGTTADIDRNDAAAQLASATGAEIAQVLGKTFLLYLAHPEKPTIRLPSAADRAIV